MAVSESRPGDGAGDSWITCRSASRTRQLSREFRGFHVRPGLNCVALAASWLWRGRRAAAVWQGSQALCKSPEKHPAHMYCHPFGLQLSGRGLEQFALASRLGRPEPPSVSGLLEERVECDL